MRGLGLALNVSLDKVGAAVWPNLNLVLGTLVRWKGNQIHRVLPSAPPTRLLWRGNPSSSLVSACAHTVIKRIDF